MTNGFQPTEIKLTNPPNCGTCVQSTENTRWISVENALPCAKEKVLFVCKNGDCFVGEYRTYGSRGWWVVRAQRVEKCMEELLFIGCRYQSCLMR